MNSTILSDPFLSCVFLNYYLVSDINWLYKLLCGCEKDPVLLLLVTVHCQVFWEKLPNSHDSDLSQKGRLAITVSNIAVSHFVFFSCQSWFMTWYLCVFDSRQKQYSSQESSFIIIISITMNIASAATIIIEQMYQTETSQASARTRSESCFYL